MQGGGPPNGRHRRGAQPRHQPAWREWIPALCICAGLIFVSGAAVLYLNLQASRSEPRKLPGTHQPAGAPSSGGSNAQLAGAEGQSAQGSDAPAQASDASPAASPITVPVLAPEPPRLSDQAEHLTDAELHGGWKLTWEVHPGWWLATNGARHAASACIHWAAPPCQPPGMPLILLTNLPSVTPFVLPPQMFDRATKHANATVVSWSSPRVVLIRDFLSPNEIEHLVQQATGAALLRCSCIAWLRCLQLVAVRSSRLASCHEIFSPPASSHPHLMQAGLSAARW